MVKLEDISSVRIKGGIFEEKTDLPLFEKNKQIPRFSLLYGKNGSGKSTISRAFRKLAGVEEKQIDSVEIINTQDIVIPIINTLKEVTYVFNEDFIEDNIRIDGDGLNTIVVMGAVKDIDDKIKNIQPDYDKCVEDVRKQQEKYDEYVDPKNKLCADFYIEEMQKVLRGDDSWASRDALIVGKKTNSQVKRDTYTKFIGLTPSKKRDELIVEFNTVMKHLEAAKTGSKKIDKSVPELKEFYDKEVVILCLLAEKIEKPVLTEREKMLFSILQEDNGSQRLSKIKTFFATKRKTTCPVCFQDVEKEYAEDLVSSIEKILSKKVEEHQQKLKNAKLFDYEVDFTSFKEISEGMVKECEEKLTLLNEAIEKLNALLNQKNDNVYEPISIKPVEVKRKYDECINILEKLENLRGDFNKKATETEPFIIRLKEINNEIAYYDIEQLYKLYRKKINEKKEENAKLLRLKADRDTWKKQIDALEQEKKNAKIAMKAINDDLAYIFFSKHRLRIEFEKEQYILYSHERAVEPNNVSVGERNAIGLCYFFNRIMESKDEADVFKQAYLLIIDDPVSSFDMENRIGILSYLKYKFGQFLNGNNDSRFLVMTHDLQLFYDARQFMGELLSKSYNISAQKAFAYIRELELDNKSVNITHLCDRSEYTALFEKVYDYALRIEPEYSMNIGNIMRKIMEAFGTFIYKKGMSELSTDENILSSLNQEDRIYFENLMYRLVLNTGSHMKEKSQTIDDMKFFDYISETDKQRTAKDIICFLYKLNSLHVMAHLKNRDCAETKIQEWCAAIS